VIVPSLCYETFGLVPIEAFAVGTPVIVHGIGALPETVANGGGITYHTATELLEAMETLRTQPQLRYQLGTQAQQHFQQNYIKRYPNNNIETNIIKKATLFVVFI
jgi:glycosyltransferase involved in cell wall biosynthesis